MHTYIYAYSASMPIHSRWGTHKRVYGELDGEWTGQRRWKKHTGGNDERKWCAWWVLNGWSVGQTLSDCLLKGWKTEGDTADERTRTRDKAWERGRKTMINVKILLPCDNQRFPCLVLHDHRPLSDGAAAIADQWTDTNLEGSEIEKRASSMFYSAPIT